MAPHMDATDELDQAQMEVNFIDYICAPLWERLAQVRAARADDTVLL